MRDSWIIEIHKNQLFMYQKLICAIKDFNWNPVELQIKKVILNGLKCFLEYFVAIWIEK